MFALGLLVLGLICLHELFAMLRARATGAPGRLPRRSPALSLAALYGDQFQVAARAVARRSRCSSG